MSDADDNTALAEADRGGIAAMLRTTINRNGPGLLLLGLALGLGFLILALREVEGASVAEALRQASLWPIVPFILAQLAFYGLKAIRWRGLLPQEQAVSSRRLVAPMMFGFAVNNLLPFRLGELVRTWVAGEVLALPKTLVLASLVVERLFDLIAISIVLVVGITVGSMHTPLLEANETALRGAVLGATIAITALVALPWIVSRRPERLVRWLPQRLASVLEGPLISFQQGLSSVRSVSQFTVLVLNSVVQWALLTFCIAISMIAVGVADINLLMACTVLGLVIFGISLPTSPGFIGTIELAFVAGMGLFAIDDNIAFAAAVYYHALSFLFVQIAGLLLYLRFRRGKIAAKTI